MLQQDIDWFARGWSAFKSGTQDDDHYPPLNDMEAQRAWILGFGAAWCECPDQAAIASILHGDGMGGESIEEAIARSLQGREQLLRQIWSHRAGWSTPTVH